jgi:hypothetical protein
MPLPLCGDPKTGATIAAEWWGDYIVPSILFLVWYSRTVAYCIERRLAVNTAS